MGQKIIVGGLNAGHVFISAVVKVDEEGVEKGAVVYGS